MPSLEYSKGRGQISLVKYLKRENRCEEESVCGKSNGFGCCSSNAHSNDRQQRIRTQRKYIRNENFMVEMRASSVIAIKNAHKNWRNVSIVKRAPFSDFNVPCDF